METTQNLKLDSEEDVLTLFDYLDAIWMQKQFDDMLALHADVKQGLKKEPFNAAWLHRRDILAHDINVLQPQMAKAGTKVAKHIEKKYGIEFFTIRPQQEKPAIVLPGTEKT